MEKRELKQLRDAVSGPSDEAVVKSAGGVKAWFAQAAPLLQWSHMASPLGRLYIAASPRGLCSLDFGVSEADFLRGLNPLARIAYNLEALSAITQQLQAYFEGVQGNFELPLDLEALTPFQVSVLQAARAIPPGQVRTYGQVARAIGKPKAGRAVGQALGRNPIPIVIPCHRVVRSDGGLGGYSGGGGLQSKRLLLRLEGAID
jgi:O-6-methylguanine DNA methyltransferase